SHDGSASTATPGIPDGSPGWDWHGQTLLERPSTLEAITMSEEPTVRELRLVVTTDDYDAAVAFYRDVLGMPVSAEYLSAEQGRVVILDAGAATLEIGDVPHGEYVDEVEVGRRVAG